jgi:hypothetical protein
MRNFYSHPFISHQRMILHFHSQQGNTASKMNLVYLLSVLAATKSSALPLDELLISTSSGPVQGYPATIESNVAAYLGIPFAQPPVGHLRFQPPERYRGETLIDGRTIVSFPL